jgi:hypothetical protein
MGNHEFVSRPPRYLAAERTGTVVVPEITNQMLHSARAGIEKRKCQYLASWIWGNKMRRVLVFWGSALGLLVLIAVGLFFPRKSVPPLPFFGMCIFLIICACAFVRAVAVWIEIGKEWMMLILEEEDKKHLPQEVRLIVESLSAQDGVDFGIEYYGSQADRPKECYLVGFRQGEQARFSTFGPWQWQP